MATLCCGTLIYRDIQAIFFDKDATLADSAPYLIELGHQRAHALAEQVAGEENSLKADLLRAFGLAGKQLNPSGLLAVSSRMQTEIAAATYVTAMGYDWHGAMAIAQAAFQIADQNMPRKAATTSLFPEARPLLEALHQDGVQLGIISADVTANIDDFVAYQGIQALIDLSWGSDRPFSKPDPAAYEAACQQLGVAPQNTLMFGDAEGDMAMAKAAQAGGAIGVLWGWEKAPTLTSADVLLEEWNQIQSL